MEKSEFSARISQSARPVIVDLWAPWCAPCRAMEPAFKQVRQKYNGQVDILKINADESPEVIRALGVMSIPTVVGFAHGKEILRRTGMQSREALDSLFDATLHERRPAIVPPTPVNRLLRSGVGLGLAALGWFWGPSILLIVLGGVLIFSAFYDRCPIYRAIVPRLKTLFHPE